MDKRVPVLVLGASGFIGARVVGALASHPAYRPVAASRRAMGGSQLALDATDPAAVRAAVRDVGAVVNCIAGSEQTMTRATEVLCAARPVRIVHLSSMAVYGAATGTAREDHASVPPVSAYGQAKIDCETLVRRYVRGGGHGVILRPTCVFGPGSSQWTTRIARLLRARRLGDLGSAGDGCCNLAFIDDLVGAVVASLQAPSNTFNISSSAELTWNAFLLRFARALGAVPVRRISRRELQLETKVLAAARRLGSKLVQSAMTEAITPSLVALFQQDIRVDCSAAVATLGLRRTPVDQMIEAAVQWLADGGPGGSAGAGGGAMGGGPAGGGRMAGSGPAMTDGTGVVDRTGAVNRVGVADRVRVADQSGGVDRLGVAGRPAAADRADLADGLRVADRQAVSP
jgi:nucleoside-diphosphate-sugar epimerase